MTLARSARLNCEALEDRTTPSVGFTVTTAADVVDPNDGVISLREAIAASQEVPVSEWVQIDFAADLAGATVELSQVGGTTAGPSAFEIRRSVQIRGSGQTITRAADAPPFRFFSVFDDDTTPLPDVTLSLAALELSGGFSDGVGGAVYSRGAAVYIHSSLFVDNSAVGSGGAIHADGGWVHAQVSTFTRNTVRPDADGVSRGGAITLVRNPEQPGGGVDDYLYLPFDTLVGNTAGEGAQVYVDVGGGMSRVSVQWSILYSPQPAGGGVADLVALLPSEWKWGTQNLIGSVSGTEWDVVSTADPLLGPLQDNGGPTRTMQPQSGSPAIDAGLGLSEGVGGLDYDQRGYSRHVGTALDLGAVEAEAGALPVMPPPPIPQQPGEPPTDPPGGGVVTVDPIGICPPDVLRTPQSTIVGGEVPPVPPVYVPNDLPTLRPTTATGAVAGQLPEVVVYDSAGQELKRFLAYDPVFLGGVSVALADVTGDGVADVVTGAGAGGGPHVKVFDGVTFEVFRGFYAYDPAFRGGVTVAVGDVTGDGVADIVTGAGPGGGPHVKAFDGRTFAEVRSFMAYDAAFRGGVSVAVQPVGLGIAESFSVPPAWFISTPGRIVTGAGPGGGPHVKVFDASTLAERQSFYAYDAAFRGGVNVAVAHSGEIFTGAGPGGGPHLKMFVPNDLITPGTPGVVEGDSRFIAAATDTGGVWLGSGVTSQVLARTRTADGRVVTKLFDINFDSGSETRRRLVDSRSTVSASVATDATDAGFWDSSFFMPQSFPLPAPME